MFNKKFFAAILSAAILLPASSFAAPNEITLPTVETSDNLSVMQALNQRKSQRNFVDKSLTPAQLSKILWAANGVNRPDGKRVNPAGKGVYCVEVYAVTRDGIYLYDAANHKLKLAASGDFRKIAANGKEAPARAGVNLIYVETPSVWSTLEKVPARDKQIFYADVMIGAMVQSVALAAQTEGLSNCVRGGVLRDEFKRAANLPDDATILLAQSVGFVE